MNSETCLITRKIEIDMGHRVPQHKSKCKNLHGHRYVVEAAVLGPISRVSGDSSEGMVIDFGDLKSILMNEIDERFDHGFMMYEKDPFAETFKSFEGQKIIFVPFIPTAENIARHFFELLSPKLQAKRLTLKHVKIWETPNSSAVFPAP